MSGLWIVCEGEAIQNNTSSGPFVRVPEGSVVGCVFGHSLQGAITMAKKKKAAAKKVAKKKKK